MNVTIRVPKFDCSNCTHTLIHDCEFDQGDTGCQKLYKLATIHELCKLYELYNTPDDRDKLPGILRSLWHYGIDEYRARTLITLCKHKVTETTIPETLFNEGRVVMYFYTVNNYGQCTMQSTKSIVVLDSEEANNIKGCCLDGDWYVIPKPIDCSVINRAGYAILPDTMKYTKGLCDQVYLVDQNGAYVYRGTYIGALDKLNLSLQDSIPHNYKIYSEDYLKANGTLLESSKYNELKMYELDYKVLQYVLNENLDGLEVFKTATRVEYLKSQMFNIFKGLHTWNIIEVPDKQLMKNCIAELTTYKVIESTVYPDVMEAVIGYLLNRIVSVIGLEKTLKDVEKFGLLPVYLTWAMND